MRLFVDELKTSERWLPMCRNEARADRDEWDKWQAGVQNSLRSAPVFEISNVAEYFYEGTSQETWDIFSDFPRPMPPFQNTWFEWKLPKKSHSGRKVIDLAPAAVFERIGCLFVCDEVPASVHAVVPSVLQYRVNLAAFGRGIALNKTFVLPVTIFGLTNSFEPISVSGISSSKVNYYFPGIAPGRVGQFRDELLETGLSTCSLIYVAMLAVSMLNCKNVNTRTITMAPALAKKHARKGHDVTVSHNVIEIQPVTELIKRQTGSAGYSRQAAAIVRGHFKNYTRGKGLFGKIKGQFWWPQRISTDMLPEYRLAAAHGDLDDRWSENVEQFVNPKPSTK